MPLLIDGHNLIDAGVFEDISLADEDDEAKLVARLRAWKSRYCAGDHSDLRSRHSRRP